MRRPSELLTDVLAENNVLPAADKPIYAYGFHQLWFSAVNLATTVALGLLVGMVWESLLFLAVYIPLRKFAGGYHADTESRCYVISTLLLCLPLCVIHGIRVLEMGAAALLLPLLLASGCIAFLAPVDTENKPLDQAEIEAYRKRSRRILALHWAFFLAFWAIDGTGAAVVIAVADTVLAGMLLLGLWKNRQSHRGNTTGSP